MHRHDLRGAEQTLEHRGVRVWMDDRIGVHFQEPKVLVGIDDGVEGVKNLRTNSFRNSRPEYRSRSLQLLARRTLKRRQHVQVVETTGMQARQIPEIDEHLLPLG